MDNSQKFTKNVHENSPKVSTKIHLFCPQKFTLSVHENSPFHEKSALQIKGPSYFSKLQAFPTSLSNFYTIALIVKSDIMK